VRPGGGSEVASVAHLLTVKTESPFAAVGPSSACHEDADDARQIFRRALRHAAGSVVKSHVKERLLSDHEWLEQTMLLSDRTYG
jgi:hypothetical protein